MQNLKRFNPWFLYAYEKIGCDTNGNPKYCVNIFREHVIDQYDRNNEKFSASVYYNVTHKAKAGRKNKSGAVTIISYDVEKDVEAMIRDIAQKGDSL